MFDNEILAQNDFNESSYAKEKVSLSIYFSKFFTFDLG